MKKAANKKTASKKKTAGGSRKAILVIHGPNLQMLGKREVGIYGRVTIAQINQSLKREAGKLKADLEIIQSNHEGQIVEIIGSAVGKYRGILINPAAYTHTSVAIRDALLAAALPTVEVHLLNIYKREAFRHHSLTAPACIGQVSGFGKQSYILGLSALISSLNLKKR